MTLFSVARPVAFKVPRAQALPTPFVLTVVIASSLTSAQSLEAGTGAPNRLLKIYLPFLCFRNCG